jgi:tripartite-type tricarboxylate transporter receptor subunit TctC
MQGIQFDARQFQWISASTKTTGICFVRKDTGVSTIEQLVSSGKELSAVAVGKGTLDYTFPAVLNGVLGTKFKLVTGYGGSGEAQAAWEKGEGDVFCGGSDNLVTRQRRLVEGNDAPGKVFIQSGLKSPDLSDPIMAGVPSALDLAKDEQGKQTLAALNVTLSILRPLTMAPEVPKDRVEAWRAAVYQTYRDPQFVEDAKQAYPNYSPDGTSSGAEVVQIVESLLKLPAPVLNVLKDLIG